MTTTALGRMSALGRAELTLLLRNRSAMVTALLLPPVLVLSAKRLFDGMSSLDEAGFSVGEMLVTAGFGLILTMTVYTTLVASYVTRREELVLKRLRTGEASDAQILASTALPVATLALAQITLLLLVGVGYLDVSAPARPDLLVAGVVLGLLLIVLASAATTIVTKTTESAQVTVMPVLIVTMMTSGMLTPLDALPDTMGQICRLMPLTPSVELLQAGLQGGMDGTEVLRALGVSLAWAVAAGYAVNRWFRWEPRQ
ncbi:ABC transporter permease [Streptomyces sp. NPDC005438]|uniref:ABC transporter permease n=1 Tax=Streptomyces sp. NPDC005438 TaxID=3156880 RepID=UPI0033A608CC